MSRSRCIRPSEEPPPLDEPERRERRRQGGLGIATPVLPELGDLHPGERPERAAPVGDLEPGRLRVGEPAEPPEQARPFRGQA
jgi:hypothetical protein